MNLYDKLFSACHQIKQSKPIILNLTNSVTQDFIANTLLALGCAPIMSEDETELEQLIQIVSSININIGTLNQEFNQRAIIGAKLARKYNKCLVLDPVGAGASYQRTELANKLANYATIIRGNASEIIAMADSGSKTLGVETSHNTTDGIPSGQLLATQYQNTIVISGANDLVINTDKFYTNQFGHELMTKITGIGCSLSAVIAAFVVVEPDYAYASLLALTYFTLCAEQAATISSAPGSFKTAFIDYIYQPNWEFIKSRLEQKG